MQKYEEGLTDNGLNKKISDAGGELLPKEDLNSNNQQVIVDGYIFLIDRSVPKVIEYVGPANGVVVTASITQNGDWQNPTATVKGTIKTFANGERITISSANVTSGSADVSSFPTTGGEYTISGITEDTIIEITATDSKGNNVTKKVEVKLVKDTTGPELSNPQVDADRMKIKISVNAVDNESGLKQIKYSISPATISLSSGTLTSGQVVELTAIEETEYTVTFTAKDNAGNTSTIDTKINVVDAMSVAKAKELVNETTLPDYIGEKVDYRPTAEGTWRIFYYDKAGEFGVANTLYLKRDAATSMTLSSYVSNGMTENGLAMMKQLNPAWKAYGSNASKTKSDTFLDNEKAVAGLCDTNNWKTYAEGHPGLTTKYAIGAPSAEMWTKAYNIYIEKYEPSDSKLNCGIKNANGYGWGLEGESLVNQKGISIDYNIEQSRVLVIKNGGYQWLASPASYGDNCVSGTRGDYTPAIKYDSNNDFCPIVAL